MDASALLAILLSEPDADVYLSKLVIATKIWISPINWWEVRVLMHSRYKVGGEAKATEFLNRFGIVIEPIEANQAQLAFAAFTRFRGRPAKLNMGDCFALALAQAKDVPLLYKGNDFAHTGVRPA